MRLLSRLAALAAAALSVACPAPPGQDAWLRARGACPPEHAQLLLQGAQAGNLDCARRLVLLGRWDCLARIDEAVARSWRGQPGADAELTGDQLLAAVLGARVFPGSGAGRSPEEAARLANEARGLLGAEIPATPALQELQAHLEEAHDPGRAATIRIGLAQLTFRAAQDHASDPMLQGALLCRAGELLEVAYPGQAAERFAEAAGVASRVGDQRTVGRCLSGQARTLPRDQADYLARAQPLFEQAEAIAAATSDAEGLATARRGHARALHASALLLVTGRREAWDQAAPLFERAARLREELGDPAELAESLQQVGRSLHPGLRSEGCWARAAELHRRAATLWERSGEQRSRAQALHDEATCLSSLEGPAALPAPRRIELWSEVARLWAELGDTVQQGEALRRQAAAWSPPGNPNGSWERTVSLLEQSVALLQRTPDDWRLADALDDLGMALRPDRNPGGSWNTAVGLHAKASRIHRKVGDPGRAGRSLADQAWCLMPGHHPDGEWGRAIALFEEAARLLAKADDPRRRAHALRNRAWCLHPDRNPDGSWASAIAGYEEAKACYAAAGEQDDVGYCEFQQGWCSQPNNDPAGGSWERAAAHYERGLPLRAQVEDQANTYRLWASCLRPHSNGEGDWTRAAELFQRGAELLERRGRELRDPERLGEAARYLAMAAECRAEGQPARASEPGPQELLERARGLVREAGSLREGR